MSDYFKERSNYVTQQQQVQS